jgi:Zn-dependent protease
MSQKSLGGIRLFQVFGITVYLHWTWFIVAGLGVEWGRKMFGSIQWATAAYLLLFAIVLLHEFGHSLACRSVGGQANRIILWPLGGAAFVSPPPRAGALLWSIVAGPLVNVVLLLISIPLAMAFWHDPSGLGRFIVNGFFAQNLVLLIFNLIPIYPLDGGQIVRALLWFVIGRVNSLAVSAWIGLVVASAGAVAAAVHAQWWLAMVAAFGAAQSWAAVKQAKVLRVRSSAPRQPGVACPGCLTSPPVGAFWRCGCGQMFDNFQHGGTCPHCGVRYLSSLCLECGQQSPMARWQMSLPLPALTRV